MSEKSGEKQDYLDDVFSKGNINTALQKDKEKCEAADLSNMWYHGKMSRSSAEKILNEGKSVLELVAEGTVRKSHKLKAHRAWGLRHKPTADFVKLANLLVIFEWCLKMKNC